MSARELVIAGGGPAGCALAIQLAKNGEQVTLIERDRHPRDKLCGEFLSPEAERELASLGVLEEVLRHEPARIRRFRFTSSSGETLESSLPGTAFGISRRRLDAILFQHAAAAGARTLEGTEVKDISADRDALAIALEHETLRADFAIAAHGRRTRLDKTLARPFMALRSPYLAMKRHLTPLHAIPALEDHVEVYTFDGGYCGLCFVEGGAINACALVEERVLDGGSDWDALARSMSAKNRALARRLEETRPADDRVEAVAQIPFGGKERSNGDGVLFAGDAAGMIAPFAGDGQAMALSSARILAELFASAGATRDRRVLAERWNRSFVLRFEARMQIARTLQRLLVAEARAGAAIRTIRVIPGLAPLLVRWTRGG